MRKKFIKLAKTFGKSDPDTQNFRNRCKFAGFSVVFYDGITEEYALLIIESNKNSLKK